MAHSAEMKMLMEAIILPTQVLDGVQAAKKMLPTPQQYLSSDKTPAVEVLLKIVGIDPKVLKTAADFKDSREADAASTKHTSAAPNAGPHTPKGPAPERRTGPAPK